MEKDVVTPFKPKFYKWFVDDIYRQRKRNEPDELFDKMNLSSQHQTDNWNKPEKILRHPDSQNFQSNSVFCVSKRKQKTDSLEFGSTKKL